MAYSPCRSLLINYNLIIFSYKDKVYEAQVSEDGEIILSAGTIQSAQLLELSGIGAQTVLRKYDIPVVVDNQNVGKNLQDHVVIPFQFEVEDGLPTAEALRQPPVFERALNEWMSGRGGSLASGFSFGGFLTQTTVISEESRQATLDLIAKKISLTSPTKAFAKSFEIQRRDFLAQKEAGIQLLFSLAGLDPYGKGLSGLFAHKDPGGYLAIMPVLQHPFSRGSVHIKSSESKTSPLIDPRLLSHPADIEILSDAVLFI